MWCGSRKGLRLLGVITRLPLSEGPDEEAFDVIEGSDESAVLGNIFKGEKFGASDPSKSTAAD